MELLRLAIIFIIFLICSIGYKQYISKLIVPSGTKIPPGPRGFPILGSVHELPRKHPWLKFFEWSKKYGEIYKCDLAGNHLLVISSTRIVQELLVRRANIYSDRPWMPAIYHNNRTSMHYLPLMGEGDGHKRGKKFIKHMIYNTPRTLVTSLTEKECASLVIRLLEDPDDWKVNMQQYVARVSAQAAWNDDDQAAAAMSVWNSNQLVPKISPDGAIENKLPFLAYLPNWIPMSLQPWRAAELSRFQKERSFWMGQYDRVRNGELKGPSWASRFLFSDIQKDVGISDEEEAAYATGMIAMIGGVLLSSPLQTLFLALIFYPEWQKKAQDEITSVCGDKIPRDIDIRDLPTVRALLRECLRWRPPVPLGVPHVLEQDDVFDGYYIRKGTICLAAEWAMTRDERLYPDPENFRPDRWLDKSFPTYKEPLSQFPEIKSNSAFGYGARTCPGQVYSEIVLFTMACIILWSCNLTRKKDLETGLDIDIPWMDIEPPNAIVRPTWFPLNIVPRSKERIEALKAHGSRAAGDTRDET